MWCGGKKMAGPCNGGRRCPRKPWNHMSAEATSTVQSPLSCETQCTARGKLMSFTVRKSRAYTAFDIAANI